MDKIPEFETKTDGPASYGYVGYPPVAGGADMPLWQSIWSALTGEGGLLRVRAAIVLSLTAFGGIYLLDQQAMPPGEFNILWGSALAYYFGTRGSS